MQSFINAIINQAAAKGISQKALAASAGVPPETLSRMKRRPSVRAGALERLALGAGLRLALVGVADVDLARPAVQPRMPSPANSPLASPLPFTQKYRQLVWSNPDAPAEVFVRQALLKPDFSVLLDAATEFGLDFVDAQWAVLMAEGSKEAARARPATERTLRNIRSGYEQAH
ncbi:MAG: helix-turn-helix transcriptional regulator [Polaromonas sp.]